MITIDLDKVDAYCKPIKSEYEVYWQRHYEESQAMRIRLMRESRIRKVCLEIAMETLEWCASNTMECIADKALVQIGQRLAELEPKEEGE